MSFVDRRGLLTGAAALLGVELSAPLARALAAEAASGFAASHTVFSAPQRTLVAAVSECIVPTTDTPGAIAAGVPALAEMMIADWYEPTDRQDFMDGLGLLEGYAWVQFEKPFAGLAPEEQDHVLTLAMTGKIPNLPASFFEHFRQLVLLGYYTSEIGCKQERVYLPVPGRYDGKFPYADVRRVYSS